jgi:hypothetical protein
MKMIIEFRSDWGDTELSDIELELFKAEIRDYIDHYISNIFVEKIIIEKEI